jgi:hypothetical protein
MPRTELMIADVPVGWDTLRMSERGRSEGETLAATHSAPFALVTVTAI